MRSVICNQRGCVKHPSLVAVSPNEMGRWEGEGKINNSHWRPRQRIKKPECFDKLNIRVTLHYRSCWRPSYHCARAQCEDEYHAECGNPEVNRHPVDIMLGAANGFFEDYLYSSFNFLPTSPPGCAFRYSSPFIPFAAATAITIASHSAIVFSALLDPANLNGPASSSAP